MSSQRAGQLGALNTATALLDFEMRAIDQGRLCHLAPYGAYRKYVSLPEPRRFEDISKNSDVVALLKSLYADPSKVEFYVGLFAEDVMPNSPLSPLILRMVAVDAFSQALANPLLSEHVFNVDTFTEYGWETIQNSRSIADILERNSPGGLKNKRISMTQETWTYRW
jgi:prostaglandin-endoperoxide synthase 2